MPKTDRALAAQHVETALKELGRDTSTSCCATAPASASLEDEWGPTLEALLAARAKGLVRMVGMSTHTVAGSWSGAPSPRWT